MIERWNRFWYGSEPRYDPMGLVRIAAVALYFRHAFERDLRGLHGALSMPPELIVSNLGLRLSPVPYPLPAEWLWPLQVGMLVAGGLAFVGLLTRPALWVLAAGAVYLSSGFAALHAFDHQQVLTLSFL